ncbi:MAG: hypothetical protein IAG10_12645 [Planctomycetaceae bacterium]|nr:hypothetical protein [Planctomycetaceae bacterium]
MVLSVANVSLNSAALDLGVKSPSFPLPTPAALNLDSSSASAHSAVSLLSEVRTANGDATAMSQAFTQGMSSHEVAIHVVGQPAISGVTTASATVTIGRQGRALEMPSLTWLLSLRNSARDDDSFQKADVVTKVATQTARRILIDLETGRVQASLRFSDAAEPPTAIVQTSNLDTVGASVSSASQTPFLATLTTRHPTRPIDNPASDNTDRPTTQLPSIIPVTRTIPSNPIPPSVFSGESIIPRPAPPEVPLVSTVAANATSTTEFTLIDKQFASDLPAELELAPSPFAPLVEPIAEPVAKAILDDVLDQPWWKAFEDPKVWLAALITLASSFAFWRVKTHRRLANS